MRQMSVISEYPIFTGFCGLTSCQRDPRDRGVTITDGLPTKFSNKLNSVSKF